MKILFKYITEVYLKMIHQNDTLSKYVDVAKLLYSCPRSGRLQAVCRGLPESLVLVMDTQGNATWKTADRGKLTPKVPAGRDLALTRTCFESP